ncbi:unnamed protein product, partial [Ectocarpus sp. 4 AP-2014]
DGGAPAPPPRLLSRRLFLRRTRRFPGAAEPATSATAAGGPGPFRPRGAGRGTTGPYRRRCRGEGTTVAPPRSRSPCLCLTTTPLRRCSGVSAAPSVRGAEVPDRCNRRRRRRRR